MELIGAGRTADVYALDECRVLRRYRANTTARAEARIMEHVRAHGFPVPAVHDCTDTDLVLDRLPGPTMLDALTRRPWLLFRYGRQLAELHDRLHTVPAPGWLPRFDGGDRVLHLDLHPGNVILTPGGPMVIDWCNARAGSPAVDLATTVVLLSTGDVPALAARLGRRLFVRVLVGASRTDPGPRIADAAAARMRDPMLSAAEKERLARFVR
ncbi:phosphotransferase [Nonomuraea sp. NPDC050310]|uniref:phosphotransferase n=1 Tax=Nonomuraea sp. NPDC050310 TaxID=3154935 RepID=UPI0033D9CFD1